MELNILRNFFEIITNIENPNNSISDSKAVRNTKNQLQDALRNTTERCTCAKRTFGGICEVCQTSGNELVALRNFFREIRKAKKNNLTEIEIKEFIKNTQKWLKA